MSDLPLIQQAVSNAGSYMQDFRQSITIQQALELYFHMEVLEASVPNVETDGLEFASSEIPVLEPGKQYRVRVWTEINGQPDHKGVRIESDLDLILALKQDNAAVYEVTIANPRIQMPKDKAQEFQYEFELTVDNHLPRKEAALLLGYRSSESKQRLRQAAKWPIKLAGTFNPIDEELLAKCKVSFGIELPRDIAILHVDSPSEGMIRLIGWGHYGPRRMETPVFEQPAIRLADFVDAQIAPDEVLDVMANFSRRSPIDLVRWLKKLYQIYGATLQLIIHDNANSEIPWEMFSFPNGIFLGELWSVVRWFYIKDATTFEELWLQPKQQRHRGGIVAYYDPVGTQVSREKQLLDELDATPYKTVQQLHRRLKQPLQDMGMVYLGTHGIFTYHESKHQIAVGSWKNPTERVLALALESLPPCQTERPIFFVNACHSGRLIRDSLGLFGLPEILLSHVAGGYIGTLGPVNTSYAIDVAEFVLRKVRQDIGYIIPAEALRRVRAHAAQKERNATNSQKAEFRKKLVYTFMYIYYGNPLSELHLTVSWDQENEDE